MSLQWSALHTALGADPGPLTYDMIRQAVAAGLVESADLDWKRALPGNTGESGDEFAKDVAAMANSGGGLLVYGVQEERGSGRARSITPVEISENTQRRLKGLAGTRISPKVSGLQTIALTADEGDEQGVLALSVPPSADIPHTIGQQHRIGIPYRYGADTNWMSERELELAYAERFRKHSSESERLNDLIGEVTPRLDTTDEAWIAAAAMPRAGRAGALEHRSRQDVRRCLETAQKMSIELLPYKGFERYSLLRELGDTVINPRVGLRRWIIESRTSLEPAALCDHISIELHHDGSLIFAAALPRGVTSDEHDTHQTPITFVESFVCDFIALLTCSDLEGGTPGPMAARLDLLRGDQRPFAGVDFSRVGGFTMQELRQPPWSRTVWSFIPVLSEINPTSDHDRTLQSAALLAEDVVNQFGFGSLLLLPTQRQ